MSQLLVHLAYHVPPFHQAEAKPKKKDDKSKAPRCLGSLKSLRNCQKLPFVRHSLKLNSTSRWGHMGNPSPC